ncbi:MAG TPA: hypothetical protein PLE61_10230 [Vicinamibacterales bacterium]|nr:hypothetical protein [Vicinamibacterales bacterium]
MQHKFLLFGIAAVAALAIACGDEVTTPAAPSSTSLPTVDAASTDAASDGSTLKATAPAPQLPANGSTLDSLTPNLVIANSTLKFLGDVALVSTLQYQFVVETSEGVPVRSVLTGAGAALTGSRVPADVLQPDTTYRWRARAEYKGTYGPWSAYWTFVTPKSAAALPSFQNATELWDNLTDGRTIGTLAGGANLVAGKGVYLPTLDSHVTYTLQSTLTSGTIDFAVEGLKSDSKGEKTKVVSMQEGSSEFTTNPFRFNVEKRGSDHPDSGKFRMRMITGDAVNKIFDSDRILPSKPLVASMVYVFHVSWGGGLVRLVVREGSTTGPLLVDNSFSYQGTYRPNPHVVHIGGPIPRGGATDATVPGMTVRYFYVSQGRQWPAFNMATVLGLGGVGR